MLGGEAGLGGLVCPHLCTSEAEAVSGLWLDPRPLTVGSYGHAFGGDEPRVWWACWAARWVVVLSGGIAAAPAVVAVAGLRRSVFAKG